MTDKGGGGTAQPPPVGLLGVAAAGLGTPTYARADLVCDDAGQFCVLELELIEPSLFLRHADPGAVEGLAAALVR